MNIGSTTIKVGELLPAFFMGSPVALILPGALMHFMPIGWALLAGFVIGMSVGVALIVALKKG